jgi:Na+/proline symporter
MQRTKIVIALAAIAALTLVAFGVASAQLATNQPDTTTNPNQAPNNGFFGWIGNCFGYGANQDINGQYVQPQAPTEGVTQAPAPYQGGYGYGYGYGPCWAR